MAEIMLALEDGGKRSVKAVVRGDLAIHAEGIIAEETGGHTFALTHIPSGLRIDGLYLRAITLKTALRNLSGFDWSRDLEAVRNNVALKNAVIAEINRIEIQSHWAHRRNLKLVEGA